MARVERPQNGPTAADITRRYIDEHPAIRDCLAWDVVNFTALARKILEEKALKNEEAVTVAIRRYQKQMQRQTPQDERVWEILRASRIEVRTRVGMVVVRNDLEVMMHVDEAAGELLKDRRHLLQLIQGAGYLTIILDDDILAVLLPGLGKSHVISISKGLATLTVRSPKTIVDTPGVLSLLSLTLSQRGVNSLETVSTHTESTFVVREADLMTGFQVLSELIHPPSTDSPD